MIDAGNISRGLFIKWHGDPVLVTDKEFYSPGKGSAVVRLKLKNLKTGNVVREVIKTGEGVEDIAVDYRMTQFLYKTGDQFVFMNPRTYEQYEVDTKIIGDNEGLIKEGIEYQLAIYEDKVIGINFPPKMSFKVIEAEDAVKGDTVTGATKLVKLETGIIVKVPLFIKQDEEITINTETKEYAGRKN